MDCSAFIALDPLFDDLLYCPVLFCYTIASALS